MHARAFVSSPHARIPLARTNKHSASRLAKPQAADTAGTGTKWYYVSRGTSGRVPSLCRCRLLHAAHLAFGDRFPGNLLQQPVQFRRDGAAGEQNSPVNPGRPLADRPAAALIGRVGDGRDVFFIGDDAAGFRVRGNGRLYLGINDDVFTDNTGTLRVTISY